MLSSLLRHFSSHEDSRGIQASTNSMTIKVVHSQKLAPIHSLRSKADGMCVIHIDTSLKVLSYLPSLSRGSYSLYCSPCSRSVQFSSPTSSSFDYRILIPSPRSIHWAIPRIQSTNRARRATVRSFALPAQHADGDLHIIVLMLACDHERICKIALETVRVSIVHGITDWVFKIHYGLADDVFGVVVHFDDAVEVLAVVGVAIFCFGQVEGAGAWDVGW